MHTTTGLLIGPGHLASRVADLLTRDGVPFGVEPNSHTAVTFRVAPHDRHRVVEAERSAMPICGFELHDLYGLGMSDRRCWALAEAIGDAKALDAAPGDYEAGAAIEWLRFEPGPLGKGAPAGYALREHAARLRMSPWYVLGDDLTDEEAAAFRRAALAP